GGAFRAEHGATRGGGRYRGARTGRVAPVEDDQVLGPAVPQDGERALDGTGALLGDPDEVRAPPGLDRRGGDDRDGARPIAGPPVAPRDDEGGGQGDGERGRGEAC